MNKVNRSSHRPVAPQVTLSSAVDAVSANVTPQSAAELLASINEMVAALGAKS